MVRTRGCLRVLLRADDVFDVADEEATEDIQQFGVPGFWKNRILTPQSFRSCVNVLVGSDSFIARIRTGKVIQIYNDEITKYAYLVMFLPMIISSGGNSGSQAASLVIRGLAIREITLLDWHRVLRREIVSGLGLGITLSVLGFGISLTFGDSSQLRWLCNLVSLIGVVTSGPYPWDLCYPFCSKLIGVDPAVKLIAFGRLFSRSFGLLLYFGNGLHAFYISNPGDRLLRGQEDRFDTRPPAITGNQQTPCGLTTDYCEM